MTGSGCVRCAALGPRAGLPCSRVRDLAARLWRAWAVALRTPRRAQETGMVDIGELGAPVLAALPVAWMSGCVGCLCARCWRAERLRAR